MISFIFRFVGGIISLFILGTLRLRPRFRGRFK